MNNQYQTTSSEILNNRWDNIFHIDNYPKLNKNLNKRVLSQFYNMKEIRYGCSSKKLIKLLNSTDFASYQSTLLRQYLQQPQRYLTPDCDFLSFVHFYKQSSKVLGNLTHQHDGFSYIKVKAVRKILSIEHSKNVGKGNSNRHKTEPVYNGVYTAFLFNDRTKFLKLYYAKHNNELSNDAIRVDFIPTRFTDLELDILFSHLKSVLGVANYKSFIRASKYRRVDIALNMPGIFQAAVFFHHQLHNKQINAGSSWPEKALAETTYIAARSSNHYICYDKILKEAKYFSQHNGLNFKQRKSLINGLALVTRLERRHFSKRNGDKELPNLIQITDVNDKLAELAILDPNYVSHIPKDTLKQLLSNKSRDNKSGIANWTILKDIYEEHGDDCVVMLNGPEFSKQKKELLNSLIAKLKQPQTIGSAQLNELAKSIKAHIEIPTYSSVIRPNNAYKSKAQNIFVKAGAGSGKTRQIIERVQHLVAKKIVSAAHVAVLAYTNKVVVEIGKKLAKKELKSVNTLTFTLWCADILKSNMEDKYHDFSFIGPTDEGTAAYEWMRDNLKSSGISLDASKAFELLGYKQNRRIRLSTALRKKNLCVDVQKLNNVLKAYSTWLQNNHKWDFESVMYCTYQALKNEEIASAVVKKYQHVLMDEMQDANKLQWEILKRLSEAGTSLFVVGDIAQSIYGYRGADPNLIAEYKSKLRNTRTYNTQANYRSSPNLLAVTNIVRRMCDPQAKALVSPSNKKGQKPALYNASDRSELNLKIVNIIENLQHQNISTKAILIMCRTKELVKAVTKFLTNSFGSKIPECTTIHKAKGLEKKACIYVDPRFSRSIIDTRSELLNLTYVSLTRAKEQLFIIRKVCNTHGYLSGGDDDINLLDILATQHHLFDKIE